ncbi:hypothetical protein LINPERHAP2_LOCUS25256 [Linum perenne]
MEVKKVVLGKITTTTYHMGLCLQTEYPVHLGLEGHTIHLTATIMLKILLMLILTNEAALALLTAGDSY